MPLWDVADFGVCSNKNMFSDRRLLPPAPTRNYLCFCMLALGCKTMMGWFGKVCMLACTPACMASDTRDHGILRIGNDDAQIHGQCPCRWQDLITGPDFEDEEQPQLFVFVFAACRPTVFVICCASCDVSSDEMPCERVGGEYFRV